MDLSNRVITLPRKGGQIPLTEINWFKHQIFLRTTYQEALRREGITGKQGVFAKDRPKLFQKVLKELSSILGDNLDLKEVTAEKEFLDISSLNDQEKRNRLQDAVNIYNNQPNSNNPAGWSPSFMEARLTKLWNNLGLRCPDFSYWEQIYQSKISPSILEEAFIKRESTSIEKRVAFIDQLSTLSPEESVEYKKVAENANDQRDWSVDLIELKKERDPLEIENHLYRSALLEKREDLQIRRWAIEVLSLLQGLQDCSISSCLQNIRSAQKRRNHRFVKLEQKLSEKELQEIINRLSPVHLNDARNAVGLIFIFKTGLRAVELFHFTVADLRSLEKGEKIIVPLKGSKESIIDPDDNFIRLLQKNRKYLSLLIGAHRESENDPLFISPKRSILWNGHFVGELNVILPQASRLYNKKMTCGSLRRAAKASNEKRPVLAYGWKKRMKHPDTP